MSNNTRSRQRALLGGLVIIAVVLILMAVLLYPRDTPDDGDEDRREGPWRDLDGFKRSISEIDHFNYYEMEGPEGLEEITDPKNSVYLMIGLEVRVSSTDCVNIGNYLDRGGHVIIADDGTNAQNITDHLFGRAGGKVNFTGHRYLVDRLFTDPGGDTGYVVNMSFIKGDTFILGGARYELLLHSPNGLDFTGPGTPLVWTTKKLTVIDMNDNWKMDLEGDRYSEFGDMMIEYDIGSNGGKITYISTTGLFTDNVFDKYENEEFIRAYIHSLIPNGGRVLLDTSKQWERYSPHVTVLPE